MSQNTIYPNNELLHNWYKELNNNQETKYRIVQNYTRSKKVQITQESKWKYKKKTVNDEISRNIKNITIIKETEYGIRT